MPAAIPRDFPEPDGKSTILFCSDASGVVGEGFGAWCICDANLARWMGGPHTEDRRSLPAVFRGPWSEHTQWAAVLIADVWPANAQVAGKLKISSNTAEAIGRMAFAQYLRGAPGVQRYIAAGDSRVVMGASDKGRSPASALDYVVVQTAKALGEMQVLSLHLPRALNQRADDLSKRLGMEVAREFEKAGIPTVTLPSPNGAWGALRRVALKFPAT